MKPVFCGGRVKVICKPAEMLENIVTYDANSLYPSVIFEWCLE